MGLNRPRLAIIGYGRLGRACGAALAECQDLVLGGIVVRPGSGNAAPGTAAPVVEHVQDLEAIQVAVVCVPPAAATGVARDLLQQRISIVECAMLDGDARERHYRLIAEAARHRRLPAIVGAGWDPGMLSLLRHAFEVLVPRGSTSVCAHPGVRLHHTGMADDISGVKGVLATDVTAADGGTERYVYVELSDKVTLDEVRAKLVLDPCCPPERTHLFAVASIAALEEQGGGIVLERRGTAKHGAHQSVLLEARFHQATFAARVMLDAVRRLPLLEPGVHRYALWGRSAEQ